MSRKQRAFLSAGVALLILMGGSYLAGFYWGFGDEPHVEYGASGGLAGLVFCALLITGYGLLGGVVVAIAAWVERGR